MKSSQDASIPVSSTHNEQPPSTAIVANDRGASAPEESRREFNETRQTLQPEAAGILPVQQQLAHSVFEQQQQRSGPYRLEGQPDGRVFDPTAFYKAREEISLKNTNIYISGMPLFFNHDDLLTLARPFGNIVEMKLLKAVAQRGNYTTLSGFVRYFHRHESDAAIKSLNNREIGPAETTADSSLHSFESFGNGKPHILSVRYASDMRTREKEIHAAERVLGINQFSSGPRAVDFPHSPPLPTGPMPMRDFHPPLPSSHQQQQQHHHRSFQGPLLNDGSAASSDPGSPQQAAGRDETSNRAPHGAGSMDPLRFSSSSSTSSSSGSASGSSSAGPESGAGLADTSIHLSSSSFRSPSVASNSRFTSAQHEHVHQTGVRYSPPLPHSPHSDGYIYYGQPQMQHYIPQASHSYLPVGSATYYNQAHFINASSAHPYHAQYLQHQPGYFPQQPPPYTGYAMGYPQPYGIQTSQYLPSFYGDTSTPDSPTSISSSTVRRSSPTSTSPVSEPATNTATYPREPTDVQALEGMMSQMMTVSADTSEAARSESGARMARGPSSARIGSSRNRDSSQTQATSTGSGQARTYRFSGQNQNHPRQ